MSHHDHISDHRASLRSGFSPAALRAAMGPGFQVPTFTEQLPLVRSVGVEPRAQPARMRTRAAT